MYEDYREETDLPTRATSLLLWLGLHLFLSFIAD